MAATVTQLVLRETVLVTVCFFLGTCEVQVTTGEDSGQGWLARARKGPMRLTVVSGNLDPASSQIFIAC